MFGTHAQLPGNGVDRTQLHSLRVWVVSVLHLDIPFLIFNPFALFFSPSLFALQSYLTSTRSLSPMSGLFGSIWAPQSDVYESCCPISPTTEHSTHMENQVMCKEYYPGFNPFRAYMNLDIWTSTANRNASFPLSRDSSYCGNA